MITNEEDEWSFYIVPFPEYFTIALLVHCINLWYLVYLCMLHRYKMCSGCKPKLAIRFNDFISYFIQLIQVHDTLTISSLFDRTN